MLMRTYIRREEVTARVLDALPVGPPGKTKKMLAKETGLNLGQVGRGLNGVREFAAEVKSEAFVHDPTAAVIGRKAVQFRYYFAENRIEAKDYLRRRLSLLQTWAANLRTGTADPALKKFGGANLRSIDRHLTRIQEDLEELVEMAERR